MDTHKPSFTIFIPTYNSEKYIRECIESAIKQEYENKRIVVLDSGSNDGTISIINNYIFTSSIEIIFTKKKLGIVDNWKRIKDFASTEWITILGHDDVLEKNFLSEMALLISVNPKSDLFTSHFELIDRNGQHIRNCQPIEYKETASKFLKNRFLGKRDSFATGYVIRTSRYKFFGGIPDFPDLLFSDDALWLLLTLERPLICSQRILFKYRFHLGSTSGTPNQTNLMDAAIKYLQLIRGLPDPRNELSQILTRYGRKQMLPLAKGYLGLSCLKAFYYGLPVEPSCFENVAKLSKLVGFRESEVLRDIKIRCLLVLNHLYKKQLLIKLLFFIFPNYKQKAGVK